MKGIITKNPGRQYIPPIEAVYTANWVIICYLRTVARTRKVALENWKI